MNALFKMLHRNIILSECSVLHSHHKVRNMVAFPPLDMIVEDTLRILALTELRLDVSVDPVGLCTNGAFLQGFERLFVIPVPGLQVSE